MIGYLYVKWVYLMLCLCVLWVKIVFGLLEFVFACSFFIYQIWFLDFPIQLYVDFYWFSMDLFVSGLLHVEDSGEFVVLI